MSSMECLPALHKYPRTPHLEGSSRQVDDEPGYVAPAPLRGGETFIYEEKLDGANAGFRFDSAGELLLQSRGHYLAAERNASRERGWALLKDWLLLHQDSLLQRFEDRYVVYGEWMATTHSVFYDRLPGYFFEFDILRLSDGRFLDMPGRRALCAGLPIASVPVLARTPAPLSIKEIAALAGRSAFRTRPEDGDWRDGLRRACALVGDDYEARILKMDASDCAEGIYLKVERGGEAVGRYKWVRPGFTQTVLAADEHWQSRFPVPNLLDRPCPGLPSHLARTAEASPADYNPDAPWGWAPWLSHLAPS